MGRVKRAYDSTNRRRQAEKTRRRVADNARRLFARDGYGPTTIEAIAREAGVAVQTFYATFGSKRAVLLALIDEMERQADLTGLRSRLEEAASDPRLQLRHVVDFNVRLFRRSGDVLAVLRAAGGADPDLRSVWQEGEERRRHGQAPLVRAWGRAGALRSDLTARRAADVLWTLTGPDSYRLFVEERGWSVSSYAEWLRSALDRLLFAP